MFTIKFITTCNKENNSIKKIVVLKTLRFFFIFFIKMPVIQSNKTVYRVISKNTEYASLIMCFDYDTRDSVFFTNDKRQMYSSAFWEKQGIWF